MYMGNSSYCKLYNELGLHRIAQIFRIRSHIVNVMGRCILVKFKFSLHAHAMVTFLSLHIYIYIYVCVYVCEHVHIVNMCIMIRFRSYLYTLGNSEVADKNAKYAIQLTLHKC